MTVYEQLICLIAIVWVPALIVSFIICMIAKLIHDEIEYNKWKREQ